ncbi:MAG: DUF222 domain-containing protein [Pseudomonadales bacterium]
MARSALLATGARAEAAAETDENPTGEYASAPNVYPAHDLHHYRLIDLFKEVRALMGQRQAIDYRLLCVLREMDQREHLDGRPLHLASWLARSFGLGYGVAREKVRTARALGHLPLLDAAFRDGRLSYSKVRALTRVATADNEAELLGIGERNSADGIEHVVRRIRQRERMDDVQELIRQRSLTYVWDEDGSLVVKARLTPEQGAIWLKAMEKAEANLDPAGQSTSGLDSAEPFDARHADAITHALEESLNDRAGSAKTSDRYQVTVHVSAETLCRSSADDEPAAIDEGPLLHPETVRRLTCDGALVSVLEDEDGQVLNVGRKTRVIPSAVRRALIARDRHCRYPGCGHRRYVDGHHIVHWAQGGETKLDNLVLLCRRHHRLVHEHGYRVEKVPDGFRFSSRADFSARADFSSRADFSARAGPGTP